MSKRKVIFDTDPGIDDAIALLTLFNSDQFEVLGITSVSGNKGIENTTANASKLVAYSKYPCKVYRGAHSHYQNVIDQVDDNQADNYTTHGVDGLGGVDLKVDPSNISSISAIDFILDCVRKYPFEVEIFSVGPMTNLALAILEDEPAMRKVKKIWSMGGGVFRGNITPVAEFNYWIDTIAVEKVYEIGDEVDIVMVGLDVTHQCIFNGNDLTFLQLAGGPKGQLMVAMIQDYLQVYWKYAGYIGVVIHDLLAVLGAIDDSIFTKTLHCNMRMVHTGLAKGQCFVDINHRAGLVKNAYIPMELDVIKTKELFIEVCFGTQIKEQYQQALKKLA